MGDVDWPSRLRDAIQDGEVRSLLASPDVPDDEAPVAEVRQAVAGIDALVEAERDRLVEAFSHFGVTSGVVDRTRSHRPLVTVGAHVDSSEADVAVTAAESIGYRRIAPSDPASWRAYRLTHGGCAFTDTETGERRIDISWPAGRLVTGRFARLFVPTRNDFDAMALPERWWFGYVAVHLARLPIRWWNRKSEPDYLGPFLVTPRTLIGPLLDFADARAGELVVDLGCGDGRILVAAAEHGCRARGLESDRDLARLAHAAVAASGLHDRIEVVHGDATTARLDDADIVVMFLPVETLRRLLPQVLARLRPGARLVVHEQERLVAPTAPDRSATIASTGGLTVAHRWNR